MNLYKYKDLFGEPATGIHSYRIFNIAIVDVIFTLIFALLISYLSKISFIYTSIGMFSLGIFMHRLFGVKTTIDKILFN